MRTTQLGAKLRIEPGVADISIAVPVAVAAGRTATAIHGLLIRTADVLRQIAPAVLAIGVVEAIEALGIAGDVHGFAPQEDACGSGG